MSSVHWSVHHYYATPGVGASQVGEVSIQWLLNQVSGASGIQRHLLRQHYTIFRQWGMETGVWGKWRIFGWPTPKWVTRVYEDWMAPVSNVFRNPRLVGFHFLHIFLIKTLRWWQLLVYSAQSGRLWLHPDGQMDIFGNVKGVGYSGLYNFLCQLVPGTLAHVIV